MFQRSFQALAAVAVLALPACSASVKAPDPVLTESMYPWTLRPPSALGSDFLWQQRLTARFGEHENSLKVAVQKQGDHLVLIGLTPFGSKAFVLDQQGEAVVFTPFVDRKMPFPPRFMLIDVQRCYLPLGDAAKHPTDGEEQFHLDGEEVTQVFANGHLIERRFRRLDGQPAGIIRIIYRNWTAGVAKQVTLDNRWFGYSLAIATLEAKVL